MRRSIRRIKVLMVVEATTAGVKRHLLTLLPALDRDQFDFTVACPAVRSCAEADTSFVEDVHRLGIPTAIVDMHRAIDPIADGKAVLALLRLMCQEQYDIVHAHSSKAGVLARLAAWLARTPVILYTPNAFAFLGYSGYHRWALVQIERLLGRLTDTIICVSEAERQVALQYEIVPARKLTVIQNGIDWTRYVSVGDGVRRKQSLGLPPEAPIVGTVGRLVSQKGISQLLKAARIVLDAHPQTQFVIVGEGPLRERLEQLAIELEISHNTVFTGFRTDVPNLLSLFDVFVLASFYEGRSYSLLEAMAAGRPIVATDISENRDLIQSHKTGLLVPLGETNALAATILYLLKHREVAEQLSQAARQAIQRERGVGSMVRQVAQLYIDCLGQQNCASVPASPGS